MRRLGTSLDLRLFAPTHPAPHEIYSVTYPVLPEDRQSLCWLIPSFYPVEVGLLQQLFFARGPATHLPLS